MKKKVKKVERYIVVDEKCKFGYFFTENEAYEDLALQLVFKKYHTDKSQKYKLIERLGRWLQWYDNRFIVSK